MKRYFKLGILCLFVLGYSACKSSSNRQEDLSSALSTSSDEVDCPYGVGISADGKYLDCQCPPGFPYYNRDNNKCSRIPAGEVFCHKTLASDEIEELILKVVGTDRRTLSGEGRTTQQFSPRAPTFKFELTNIPSIARIKAGNIQSFQVTGTGAITFSGSPSKKIRSLLLSQDASSVVIETDSDKYIAHGCEFKKEFADKLNSQSR